MYSATTTESECGELVGDFRGNFIKGFTYHIESGHAFSAEIWAHLLGLKMACAMGIKKVWVQTNSLECLDLILHEHG